MSDVTTTTQAPKNPALVLKEQLERYEPEFRAQLPAHMPSDRFMRVVLTAISQNPKLATVERRSFINACNQAAKDGLYPDGREAALVIFDDKKRGPIAQYIPMIAGIRKKARNTGEITLWETHIVYQLDEFEYELGDEPLLRHRPHLGADRGDPIAIYSIAVLKGGERSREVMSVDEINGIRERSSAWRLFKAKKIYSTPWDSDWGEMARKTVARRHSKSLPLSSDIEALFHREDELYGNEAGRGRPRDIQERLPAPNGERKSITERLDSLVAKDPDYAVDTFDRHGEEDVDAEGKGISFNEETGEIVGYENADFSEVAGAPDSASKGFTAPELAKILTEASIAAEHGSNTLTKWLNALAAPDFLLVEPHLKDIRAAAAAVDKERKNAQ